jgi:hypothetical protein
MGEDDMTAADKLAIGIMFVLTQINIALCAGFIVAAIRGLKP